MGAVRIEKVGAVARVTLDEAERRNALTDDVLAELVAAFAGIDDDPELRCVVLAGSPKVFASGADLRVMAERDAVEMYFGKRAQAWDALARTRTPMVAAVSGFCLGGGLELAMYADLIVASESAVFGLPETQVGLTPGAGGTLLLSRRIGQSVAMEMILAGRTLGAAKAEQLGLVARVSPVDGHLELAIEIAETIAGRSTVAQRLARESVRHALRIDELRSLSLAERRGFAMAFASEDGREGVSAFLEKRPPAWGQDR